MVENSIAILYERKRKWESPVWKKSARNIQETVSGRGPSEDRVKTPDTWGEMGNWEGKKYLQVCGGGENKMANHLHYFVQGQHGAGQTSVQFKPELLSILKQWNSS